MGDVRHAGTEPSRTTSAPTRADQATRTQQCNGPDATVEEPLAPVASGLLRLQRTIGNRAVLSLLAGGPGPADALRGRAEGATRAVLSTVPSGWPPGLRLQRQIGNGQAGRVVQHNGTGQRYVAHDIDSPADAQHYRLQPLAEAGTEVGNVPYDDPAYDVVGDVGETDLSAIADEPSRRAAAGAAARSIFSRVGEAYEAKNFDGAITMLKSVPGLVTASSTPAGMLALAKDDKALDDDLKAKLKYGNIFREEYKKALLLPSRKILDTLAPAITRRKGALKGILRRDINAEEAAALAKEMQSAVEVYRCDPDLAPTLLRLVEDKKGEVTGAYEKSVAPLLAQPEFLEAYLGMAKAKYKIAKKGDAKDTVEEAVGKFKGGADKEELRMRGYLLYHLGKPIDAKALQQTVDGILTEALASKADRLKYVFEQDPQLMEDCTERVHVQALHQTLLAMKNEGKEHSIKDINDYVGDKLNDPLMKWVIAKNIPVEVHATSALLSLAGLKKDGYTDIIEVPSSHTGTKKYVAANPISGTAKVVFQTQPGASYAIQTAGQFLFYELYKELGPSEKITPTETSFVHEKFKARNMLSASEDVARYLLLEPGTSQALIAEVPFVGAPPKIGPDGSIKLVAVGATQVTLKRVEVQTLPPKQLKVLAEDLNWADVYTRLLSDSGITGADIACIGRKSALIDALGKFGVKASYEVDLAYFNVSLFRLKKSPAGEAKLLAFRISPDFFGDRAGALATALRGIGVTHITFVGTAGGLGEGIAKGDVIAPTQLANYAEEKLGEPLPNVATELVKEGSGLKKGGKHVSVHSPITESQEMIDKLKADKVSSVDCEAGFIADALRGSDVNLYALYYISDVPGSQESIGMGGTSASEETAEAKGATGAPVSADSPGASEKAVLEVVKLAIKRDIEAADAVIARPPHEVDKDGILKGTLESGEPGQIQLTVVPGPKQVTTGNPKDQLLFLVSTMKKVVERGSGSFTAVVLGELNKCALQHYRLSGQKVLVGAPTKIV